MEALQDEFRSALPEDLSPEEANDDFETARRSPERVGTPRVAMALAAAGIAAVALVASRGGQRNQLPANGFTNIMDAHQQMTYQTMLDFQSEARASLERHDYGTAFDRYGKIIRYSGQGGMDRIGAAQLARSETAYSVTALHEFLVLRRLQNDTTNLAPTAAEKTARIEKDTMLGRDAMTRAPRITDQSAAEAVWGEAIGAWRDLLSIDPGNPEAQRNLVAAETEYRKTAGEIASDWREELDSACKQQMLKADTLAALDDARAVQSAIVEYAKLDEIDIEHRTHFPVAAGIRIAALKKKLAEMAAPDRQAAISFKERRDWRAARLVIRRAMAVNPYDPTLNEIYDAVEKECLRDADSALQEAKVYFAAEDYRNASASANLALTFADRATDRQNQAAREILKKIERAGETWH